MALNLFVLGLFNFVCMQVYILMMNIPIEGHNKKFQDPVCMYGVLMPCILSLGFWQDPTQIHYTMPVNLYYNEGFKEIFDMLM